jgi:hypothetical protein
MKGNSYDFSNSTSILLGIQKLVDRNSVIFLLGNILEDLNHPYIYERILLLLWSFYESVLGAL